MKFAVPKGPNFLPSLVVSSLLGSILFFAVVDKLRSGHCEDAALLVIAAFTFMFTVSGFLFTRAQAWPKGKVKRRTLYAAELCLGASTFLGLQILGASISFFVFKALGLSGSNELDYLNVALLFGFFIFNGFKASFNFFYGVRVAIHKKPWSKSPLQFLRSQKTL